ncbi:MAG: purine-nucleoside phosphorylase [Oscillospiraceae bacterium]|nr:purine-nucleoside phosphorylase [Oscillospiraceae bacterium]
MKPEEKLYNIFDGIKDKIPFEPQVALILGSGLGNLADKLDIVDVISYNDIEGFPVSTVAGHKGRFVFAHIGDVRVVIMQGRVHFYEGYDINDVVLPVRLMKLMGAKILFVTNAAGGVNEDFMPGDLMMITDHIAKFVPSCLLGKNIDTLGERFPDMSTVYNENLCGIIRENADKIGVKLREGVYLQFTGPEYETPAEVRMSRILGADAVGMSTACEAVAANHMNMMVCGISCITNMASGILKKPLNHKEVQETADMISEKFEKLVISSIRDMSKILG